MLAIECTVIYRTLSPHKTTQYIDKTIILSDLAMTYHSDLRINTSLTFHNDRRTTGTCKYLLLSKNFLEFYNPQVNSPP